MDTAAPQLFPNKLLRLELKFKVLSKTIEAALMLTRGFCCCCLFDDAFFLLSGCVLKSGTIYSVSFSVLDLDVAIRGIMLLFSIMHMF